MSMEEEVSRCKSASMSEEEEEASHFVFVHGACHGAWCWYKVMDLLRRVGHRATAIDLAASGRHPADADSVASFQAYNQPLSDFLHSLPLEERRKVILVGHSLGGISLTHAAEEFPGQVAALVYVAAAILPSGLPLREHFVKVFARCSVHFFYKNGVEEDPTSFIFTSDSIKETLYSTSPSKDVVLASMLLRPSPVQAQLAPKLNLTHEGFKSIPKVYVSTLHDQVLTISIQERMARDHHMVDVFSLEADHSPFFSAAKELQTYLLHVHAKHGAHLKAQGRCP